MKESRRMEFQHLLYGQMFGNSSALKAFNAEWALSGANERLELWEEETPLYNLRNGAEARIILSLNLNKSHPAKLRTTIS